MKTHRHILFIGSRTFAKTAASLLGPSNDFDTAQAPYVNIGSFLASWRPDCAVVNCDELQQDVLTEIGDLSRLQTKLPVVLVSSSPVPEPVASAVQGILRPSEVHAKLALLVKSVCR